MADFVLKATAPMEVQEFLFAETAAKVDAAELARHVRSALYFHRFQVMNWLMLNGVAIPIHLMHDQMHPTVGNQFPDLGCDGKLLRKAAEPNPTQRP